MAESVIYHQKPRGKREGVWAWTTRRLLALVLTLVAIAAATWVMPYLQQSAPRFPQTHLPSVAVTPELPAPVALEPLAGPPSPPARVERRDRGVPLDAVASIPGEDYEILTASELAAISQAREE